jgi:AbrB family looped-hinge helix DNA binding protein
MEYMVRITRRGQATVPIEIRRKYGIEEGDEVVFEDRDGEIIIRVIPRLEEMAGIYAAIATPEEMKKRVDSLREEYLY